jgi:hypothetical protein
MTDGPRELPPEPPLRLQAALEYAARGGCGLIPLPPSRTVDGAVGRWLRPLRGAALPDGERVYESLAALPGDGELASSIGDPPQERPAPV